MKHKISILFLSLFLSGSVQAQLPAKIMSYNLLNYPGTDTAVRNPYFRTVIAAANPDILVVCEITSQAGVNNFLTAVMNFGSVTYSAGTFINGYDTDNAIFYKTSKFNFISNTPVHTQLRDINEFKLTDKVYHDTLRIYGLHLRAGDTSIVRRGWEIDSLRRRTDQLPAGSDFLVVGDFNIYGSSEPAYQKLKQDNPGDDGNVTDPLNMTGVWNTSSYAPYHTQSTRTRFFGDGSTGGMDDRFDMILFSQAVKNSGGIRFVPGTYTSFGNDGHHYNDSINKIPNTAVTQTIANALHYASDHLPVFAMFEFGSATILNLRVIPQGFYDAALNRLRRKDTINIFLRSTVSPYLKADSSKTVIDSLTFVAQAFFRFAGPGIYYLQVSHRNSIETWSRQGGVYYAADSLLSYDFTVSDTAAYGNNMTLKGGRYCIFSGDVDQDGTIDAADLGQADSDAFNFAAGYLPTDVNGDNLTDASDIVIIENNALSFVTRIIP